MEKSYLMLKKTSKLLIKILLGVVILVLLNAFYYFLHHQYKTADKIHKGESINLYEKASILTLHTAVYTLGYLYCPDAAYGVFKMYTKNDTVYRHSDRWLSPKVMDRFNKNIEGKMAWNGDIAYKWNSPERHAAITLNYCYLKKRKINGKMCYTAECPYTFKVPSKTTIDLGFFSIVIFEELFYELEKIGILHPFTMVCYYEID